jgi:hypothetical protein
MKDYEKEVRELAEYLGCNEGELWSEMQKLLTKVKADTVAEILSMAPGAQDTKTEEMWYDPGVMEYMARIASLTRPT